MIEWITNNCVKAKSLKLRKLPVDKESNAEKNLAAPKS